METIVSARTRTLVALAAACLIGADDARAQAWLPAAGEGSVSVVYSNSVSDRHLLPTTAYDIGRIDSHALLADVTYGITDRLAVSLGLPLIASRYRGDRPHQRTNPDRLDDGDWHSSWQDLRVGVRYNVLRGPVMVTSYVGSIVPSHDYEYFAHSAAGRRLKELQAGVSVGHLLQRGVPGLFVQGRYAFGFVEQTLDIRPNRSNLDLEVGYFVTPSLRIFALGAGQLTHAGIDVYPAEISVLVLTPEQISHHDQIDRINFVKVGAGASMDLGERFGVFASYGTQVAGRNGHELGRSLAIGATWTFSTRKKDLVVPEPKADAEALARCACQKGSF